MALWHGAGVGRARDHRNRAGGGDSAGDGGGGPCPAAGLSSRIVIVVSCLDMKFQTFLGRSPIFYFCFITSRTSGLLGLSCQKIRVPPELVLELGEPPVQKVSGYHKVVVRDLRDVSPALVEGLQIRKRSRATLLANSSFLPSLAASLCSSSALGSMETPMRAPPATASSPAASNEGKMMS